MRLIDANKLKKSVPKTHFDIYENCRNCRLLSEYKVRDLIDEAPTVNAVQVVRCKECKFHERKWCTLNDRTMHDKDFCSYGERKDGNNK